VLNAANEVGVASFLAGHLPFLGIPELVERTLAHCETPEARDLAELVEIDTNARRIASALTTELVA
jgi:1-deoxy-D-xylulose-5-phosphate reductoisomerase